MVEKNFFGKWKYQQLDEKGNPALLQTMNTRRRRNVSYHTVRRRSSLIEPTAEQDAPLKYTSEVVRKSDNYTLKTGDCVFYQEAKHPLEAWFIYNILYKELDRSIDVMVIRLVDWDFLEREYNFICSDHVDKFNELIVFSEFDVIMSDSWYQTINVSSYEDYKEEKKKNLEYGESHKYVRYLFDLANKCLREINYSLFKEQCTCEDALENFKRLISSGHEKALLHQKRLDSNLNLSQTSSSSGPSQGFVKCPSTEPLDNKNSLMGKKDQKDLICKRESVGFFTSPVADPKNVISDGKSNKENIFSINSNDDKEQKGDSFIFEKVKPNQIKQEACNYPLSLGDIIAVEGLSTIKDMSSNDDEPVSRDSSLELVRNGENKANESISENTDSSTSGSFTASIKNKRVKLRDTGNLDSELLSNGLSMYKTFPVHFDDFNKRMLSLKASYLATKKRHKGKIVVNPDNIDDITLFHPILPSEYEPKKQKQKIKSLSVSQEQHTELLKSKKENNSFVGAVDYIDTTCNIDLKAPNIAYLNTMLDLNLKKEPKKCLNNKNYLQKNYVDIICKKVSADVLFREKEMKRIILKLREFVNESKSSFYIISGTEGCGKLYLINKVVNEFLKFVYLPISCLTMKYEEGIFEKKDVLQCFVDQLLSSMHYREEALKHHKRDKHHKFVVIIDQLELFLDKNPAFVSSLLKWAQEMEFEMLFICNFSKTKKNICIGSDIEFSSYNYNQLSEIMQFTLERESEKYNFYTEKYSGAVVFSLNEASRLDMKKNKSKYIMHNVTFSTETLKYLDALASKPQYTIGQVLETALKAIALIQETYYNEHPVHNTFKSFESTVSACDHVNNNASIITKEFIISVEDIQRAEGLLNNWANKKMAESLKSTSKLTLWVLTKMQREGSTNDVSTFAFFQFFEKSLIENADNPVLKEIMSIVTSKGSIGTNFFNWDYVFEELTNSRLINNSRSKDGKIISLSLINKPAVEKMLSSFARSLQ